MKMRRRIVLGSTVAALLLSGAILLSGAARKQEALPVRGTIGEFLLTDSTGNAFGSDQLKGRICVADFIFTRCDGLCPLLTKEMKKLHETFANNPAVQLVSVTVDPEFDTPEVLAEFARHNDIDTGNWHLLTGTREAIRSFMVEECMIGMPDDPLLHSDRLVLWDQEMRIRGYYPLSDPEAQGSLAKDISRLLRASRDSRTTHQPLDDQP
ncbi:MAG: SCO family protein [Roseibacillus sp.]|nr:SCO family protein [Roseibacillus sp.]